MTWRIMTFLNYFKSFTAFDFWELTRYSACLYCSSGSVGCIWTTFQAAKGHHLHKSLALHSQTACNLLAIVHSDWVRRAVHRVWKKKHKCIHGGVIAAVMNYIRHIWPTHVCSHEWKATRKCKFPRNWECWANAINIHSHYRLFAIHCSIGMPKP